MSNMEILQALIFEPRKAFAGIAERPRFFFPLFLIVLTTAVMSIWYTSVVDIAWLADRELRHGFAAGRLTEEQIAVQVQNAVDQRGVRAAIGGISTIIVLPLLMLVAALYYFLAGKVTNVDRSYRQWLAFSNWTALPSTLAVIPAALVLLTAETNQFGQEAMQVLSLNALIFHRTIDQPGFSLLNGLNLLQFVGIYLSIYGVKLWSGRSWLFSTIFILIPWLLIYVPWAWFSFRG
jgi:hypothetical protein